MEKAIQLELKKFVAHQKVQNSFSHMRYQHISHLEEKSALRVWLINQSYSFLYFLWPILTCFPPWTRIGELLEAPAILFECHLMSEIMFLLLLVLNTVTRTDQTDFLGALPTVYEWLIFIFIVGKCVGEIDEMRHRGWNYFKDQWNYFDMVLLLLFWVAIFFRVADIIIHVNSSSVISKLSWGQFEPRLFSTGFLSLGYILAFMRLLSFSRNSRLLGLLRVSLSKMLKNVVQFLIIFCLLLFAFALSLSELYWQYGTSQGVAKLCEELNNTGSDCDSIIAFSTLDLSMRDMKLKEKLCKLCYEDTYSIVYQKIRKKKVCLNKHTNNMPAQEM